MAGGRSLLYIPNGASHFTRSSGSNDMWIVSSRPRCSRPYGTRPCAVPVSSPKLLPAGHPFSGVRSDFYWSSTTYTYDPIGAWIVFLLDGSVNGEGEFYANSYVWPVRGGHRSHHGHDD